MLSFSVWEIEKMRFSTLTTLVLALFLAGCAVEPTSNLRTSELSAPTPATIPGARTITTAELVDLRRASPRPVLIDVMGGTGHNTIPGSVWLQGAGVGTSFDDGIQSRLVAAVTRLTQDDKNRTVVTFCPSEHCWASYNTALRLARAGFTDVRWYRGGMLAWNSSQQPTEPARAARW
jgi:PQQ-dependent catabolism-associated CXXCW motif protein